jgi:hypothetical protein
MHKSLDSGMVRLTGKRSQEIIDAKYQARQVKRALVGPSSNGNFRAYVFRHELCRFHQDREPTIARGIGHLQAIDFIEALNRRSNNPRRFVIAVLGFGPHSFRQKCRVYRQVETILAEHFQRQQVRFRDGVWILAIPGHADASLRSRHVRVVQANRYPVRNFPCQYGLHTFARIHAEMTSPGNFDSLFFRVSDKFR